MSGDEMRARFVRVASELLDQDDRMALVLADISVDRFAASGASVRHPERVINVGIREQLLVNVAAGMALAGMRPIAHTFASFLVERAFEQVKLGFSHQGVGGILVSAGASYDVAAYGRTHQSPGDVALLATLPGWRIHIPGHADEVETLLTRSVEVDDPVYIRLAARGNREAHADSHGRLLVCRRGPAGSATIIAVGPMLDAVLAATEHIDVTVAYTNTVRPFDADGLRAAVTGECVVIAEPYLEGTSAAVLSAALFDRPHRLLSIGVPNKEHRKYGTAAEHDAAHGLDAFGIRLRLEQWIRPAAA